MSSYGMRMSDWSSEVCSSDPREHHHRVEQMMLFEAEQRGRSVEEDVGIEDEDLALAHWQWKASRARCGITALSDVVGESRPAPRGAGWCLLALKRCLVIFLVLLGWRSRAYCWRPASI